ncbi:MAG: polysaccharide deacetylase family protein, partial [Actinobacteria bacterium]|nr:polysaccharide deacetylase family protein [Actinomycetota bacterium]
GRWDIEAHSHDSHHEQEVDGGRKLPALTSLEPGESLDAYRARIREDLDRNDAAIEDHTGHEPVAFAYPFGAYGGDRTNDPGIRAVLSEEVSRRYAVAFQQDEQDSIPLLDPAQDHTTLRRLEVGDWSGADLLARIAQAAAGSGSTGAGPGSDHGVDLTLTAPANGAGRDTVSAAASRMQPGRPARLRPAVPGDTTSTTGQSGAALEPVTTMSEPSTTTSTEPPSTTTTTEPPATTTTTTGPPTTSTTQPPTTTTTGPSGSTTTTTTEKPCHGKGGKGCHR